MGQSLSWGSSSHCFTEEDDCQPNTCSKRATYYILKGLSLSQYRHLKSEEIAAAKHI